MEDNTNNNEDIIPGSSKDPATNIGSSSQNITPATTTSSTSKSRIAISDLIHPTNVDSQTTNTNSSTYLRKQLDNNFEEVKSKFEVVKHGQQIAFPQIPANNATLLNGYLDRITNLLNNTKDVINQLFSGVNVNYFKRTDLQRQALDIESQNIFSARHTVGIVEDRIKELDSSLHDRMVSDKGYFDNRTNFESSYVGRRDLEGKYNYALNLEDREDSLKENSKKRDREDDGQPEGSGSKKQKTDQQQGQSSGSLIDDFADVSTEFPGYTDGDD